MKYDRFTQKSISFVLALFPPVITVRFSPTVYGKIEENQSPAIEINIIPADHFHFLCSPKFFAEFELKLIVVDNFD
jgi:hypothetical protein